MWDLIQWFYFTKLDFYQFCYMQPRAGSHTSQNDKVKLERFQKLCTRIMIPYEVEMKRDFHCLSSKSWIYILIFFVWNILQRFVIMTITHAKKFWNTKRSPFNKQNIIYGQQSFHKYTWLLCYCCFLLNFGLICHLIDLDQHQ